MDPEFNLSETWQATRVWYENRIDELADIALGSLEHERDIERAVDYAIDGIDLVTHAIPMHAVLFVADDWSHDGFAEPESRDALVYEIVWRDVRAALNGLQTSKENDDAHDHDE